MRYKTIIEFFLEQVKLVPTNIAVLDNGREMTYEKLHKITNSISNYLEVMNVKEEDVIGVYMDRSYLTICAILGIIKAGAAFWPIDKSIPLERVKHMCKIANVKIIILDQPIDYFSEFNISVNILDMIKKPSDSFTKHTYYSNQLAYIIFTSGSTGMPKGAMLEYAGMTNHIDAKIDLLNLDQNSIFAFNAPLGFDICVWQMLAPLCVGAQIVVFSNEDVLHISKFCNKLNDCKVTHLELVPTYINLMLDYSSAKLAKYPCLRSLVSTGDTLSLNLVLRWLDTFPSIPIINSYGPTEASDDVTHCIIKSKSQYDIIPIGKPIKNAHLYVLDEDGNHCGAGEKGELVIGGICVGRGYLGGIKENLFFYYDKKMKERCYRTGDIVTLDVDGNYLYWGRKDRQIKLNGHRIELCEIEHFVEAADKHILRAIALLSSDTKFINVFFIASIPIESIKIKKYLQNNLPTYMMPSNIIQINEFPMNANGKIDTALLNKNYHADMKYSKKWDLGNSDTEKEILKLLAELFERELPTQQNWRKDIRSIGIDSLFIIRLIVKIEEFYGFQFSDEDMEGNIVYDLDNLVQCVERNIIR